MAQKQDPRDKKIAAKVANGVEGQGLLEVHEPVDETPPVKVYQAPPEGVEEAFERGRTVGFDEGVKHVTDTLTHCSGSTCGRPLQDNEAVILKGGRVYCRTFCAVYGA